MKKIKILLLVLFMLVPSVVKAHTIRCDNGSFDYGSSFSCYIEIEQKVNYDELSGTISTDENIICQITSIGPGFMAGQVADPKTQFAVTGLPTSLNVLSMSCQVIGQLTETGHSQVVVRDYKYHEYGTSVDATNLVVRSDLITINPYVEEEEPVVDTKPRDTSNNNSLLKSIYDENLNFSFSKFITVYDIEVLYEVEKLDLIIMPVNKDANIRLEGNENLSLGENVIDIYVTSPDNTSTTCYTLNIKRLARGEAIYYPRSDSSLQNLTVIGQSIKFDKETYDYTINIDSETNKVEVNPTPTNAEATVDISDTDNLNNGDLITITVRSADGTSETKYRIRVLKAAPKEDITLYIVLGVIGLVALGVIVLIIKSNKKDKEDPLLSIKTNKRKVKKGEKLDDTVIPEVTANTNVEAPQPTALNVITESSAVANIISVQDTPIQDDRNKVTAVTTTLDLNVAANAAPIAIADTTPQPQVADNNMTNTLGSEAQTLDLTAAVMPTDLSAVPNTQGNQIPIQPQVSEQGPINPQYEASIPQVPQNVAPTAINQVNQVPEQTQESAPPVQTISLDGVAPVQNIINNQNNGQ